MLTTKSIKLNSVRRLTSVNRRIIPTTSHLLLSSSFHSSRSSNADPQNEKSPFSVFVDTFKNEWSKSKELQSDIKALQDETGRMAESGAYKKAKEALDKAKSSTSTASSVTGDTLKKAGKVVGTAAVHAWDSPIMKTTRTAVNKTADTVDKATEPIRQTEMYKNLKDVIDDGSSMRYGGFEEKEERRKRRELEEKKRLEEELKTGVKRYVKANPEAGDSVIMHETAKPEKSWKDDFEKTTLGKKASDLRIMYEESENGLVSTVRSITDTIGSFFAETESGKVIRLFKQMDPNFTQEEFLKEVRQYILPEVLDAYVKGDKETLSLWLSEAPLNIWAASAKQYQEQGLYSAGRVLDIRGVDILSAKLLQPADIPVFVIGCRAQEVHLYKNIKTNEIAAGVEDSIQLTTYAMVMTRIPEDMDNQETKGWKLLELVRGQSREWT